MLIRTVVRVIPELYLRASYNLLAHYSSNASIDVRIGILDEIVRRNHMRVSYYAV